MTFTDTETEAQGEVLFSGRLWGLTRDERSVKIVQSGPGTVANFGNLRDRDVIVLAAPSSQATPFIVRPHPERSGRWQVVETRYGNIVATSADQGNANQVRDVLTLTAGEREDLDAPAAYQSDLD